MPRCLACTVLRALDYALDSASVMLFSNLVGPPKLQRLAEEAFEAINAYGKVELQQFYNEFLEYLDSAQIKWVCVPATAGGVRGCFRSLSGRAAIAEHHGERCFSDQQIGREAPLCFVAPVVIQT